jgi:hypothetical protein
MFLFCTIPKRLRIVGNQENLSNTENWPAEAGQSILDSFRKSCQLLTDAPDPDHLPPLPLVAKAAELAMWLAWANARDWIWWNKVYDKIDTVDTKEYTGRSVFLLTDVMKSALELNPILMRLNSPELNVGAFVQKDTGMYFGNDIKGTDKILDLRKLRRLRLQHLPNLPFSGMEKLDFSTVQTNFQLGGGDFLESLRNVRPVHIKVTAP